MPTTTVGKATEFIAFSRTGLATVVDSDGNIKWALHNLLLASEQFQTTTWVKTSLTVAANAEDAPDGSKTADTLTASGANGTVLQTWTAEAVPYTFSVWLKRKTGTGSIQIAADNGSYTTVTITSSWVRYSVTQTPAAGSKSAGIRIVTSGDEVYVWGAHVHRADLGGMQANASAYPTYNPTTPKNLLGFTESLATGWTNTNTTDAVVDDADPFGLPGSVEVTATGANGTLLASVALLASPYTFSIWLKRKTGTGTVEITVDGTTFVTASVTASWTRFSATLTPSAGTKTPGIRLVTSGDAVYAWGAQLSDSGNLTPYSANLVAASASAAYYGPRREFDPITFACRGLLVEGARTNVVKFSNDLTKSDWVASSATVAQSQTGPDGASNSASLVTATASNAIIAQGCTATSSVRFQSAYIKRVTGTGVVEASMDYAQPSIVTWDASADTYSQDTPTETWTTLLVLAGWTRLSIPVQTVTDPTVAFRLATNGDAIAIYGVQNENGDFATSLIPTLGASVTRAADIVTVDTTRLPYDVAQGSLVVSATPLDVSAERRAVQIDDGTENDRVTLGTSDIPDGVFTVIDGGSPQAVITSGTPAAGSTAKLAARWKVNDFALSVNGGPVVLDTGGTLPDGNVIRLGSGVSSAAVLNGYVRQLTYLPRTLSNAELQNRSA